jgi:hypothetical protein
VNTTASRISLAIVAMIFVVVTVFAITATWVWDWKLSLPATTDKATRVNTVIAVSAYAAAMIGVVIALIAYWQASGRPSLEPEITFPRSLPNELMFEAYRPLQLPDWIDAVARDQARMLQIKDANLLCTITIKNSTRYAAQNPGLRIRFEGLYLNTLGAGWSVAESWGDRRGAKAIQWDGGTENIIHGKWSRRLPDLDFSDAIIYQLDPPPALGITIVSDGCRPRTRNIKINLRDTSLG